MGNPDNYPSERWKPVGRLTMSCTTEAVGTTLRNTLHFEGVALGSNLIRVGGNDDVAEGGE